MAKSVADLLVETLAVAGVERVYGLPGDSLNGFTDAIRRQGKMQWIHVRHEEVAAFANLEKINEYVKRSLMLVTALAPVIGYDKASQIAHYALDNDLTLKDAALKLGFISEEEFDRIVDPRKIVKPYVATAS
jgi:hypothetical protein